MFAAESFHILGNETLVAVSAYNTDEFLNLATKGDGLSIFLVVLCCAFSMLLCYISYLSIKNQVCGARAHLFALSCSRCTPFTQPRCCCSEQLVDKAHWKVKDADKAGEAISDDGACVQRTHSLCEGRDRPGA